jgi:hypothetical protein
MNQSLKSQDFKIFLLDCLRRMHLHSEDTTIHITDFYYNFKNYNYIISYYAYDITGYNEICLDVSGYLYSTPIENNHYKTIKVCLKKTIAHSYYTKVMGLIYL